MRVIGGLNTDLGLRVLGPMSPKENFMGKRTKRGLSLPPRLTVDGGLFPDDSPANEHVDGTYRKIVPGRGRPRADVGRAKKTSGLGAPAKEKVEPTPTGHLVIHPL